MSNIQLLRNVGRGFIWIGAATCGLYLVLSLPGVGSFSGLLLTLADTVGRLASTVGLGAVILALTEVADAVRTSKAIATRQPQESEIR